LGKEVFLQDRATFEENEVGPHVGAYHEEPQEATGFAADCFRVRQ
jgi:hypothetical protein